MARYIMGIDEGTSLVKVLIFDQSAKVISNAAVEIRSFYPRPGWVEQDPDEILSSTLKAAGEALKNGRILPEEIEAIGITNQLLTTIFWNKHTGEAIGRAIVWQDDRTLSICEELAAKDKAGIEERSGSHIFPNCSATKIKWLMENDRAIQKGLGRGDLLYGTVDTWLIWKLSGGQAHVTDLSNACLTLLLNTHSMDYDEWMIGELGIPLEILPKIHSSSEIYAYTKPENFLGVRLPISGDAGDQFTAVFGQACFQKGDMLCNMGTGASIGLNMGDQYLKPVSGMDSPILWAIDGQVTRGMGGWTNISGAAIQWMRDELGIIHDYTEAEVYAAHVPDTHGTFFVPAFAGLGSPYQDPYARGTFFGITQSTTKNHLVRAALEAIAYQVRDCFEEIQKASEKKVMQLHVGGGVTSNAFLMQFLADILGISVIRPVVSESSVLGAAFLAGLATGYWESLDELKSLVKVDRQFEPGFSTDHRDALYRTWLKAIDRSRGWLKD
ncbi:MAG TPA: glycerol kinase GlpK [Anaerolineales bacterium]|nr:glycerol kinase GlpK [Anaerolineales bacterium]